MARPKKQKAKPKAVKDGKKPASSRPRRAGASSTSPVHDAAPAPKATATEKKKSTMTGGISKKTSRRMPARSGKKDPWSEEQLTTSSKSRIIDVDLVKLFANPNSWTCLDEDEKRELLSLLPAHIHPNPGPDPEDPEHKIEPLSPSFLRYSNNWRDAVRGFQFDLESGRYEPEWQAQAALAMEERALGKYDKFKEDQYEEFWGQKQKLSWDVETGDSSQIKLETLVRHGVVRPGDVWKFSRYNQKILLEKEVKILRVEKNNALTFVIPGGQRVFLSHDHSNSESPVASDVPETASPGSQPNAGLNSHNEVESKQEAGSMAGTENGMATKTKVETKGGVEDKPMSPTTPPEPPILPTVDGDPASKEDASMNNAPPTAEDTASKGDIPTTSAPPTTEDTATPPTVDDTAPEGDTPMPNAPPAAEATTPQDTVTENIVPQNATPEKIIAENATPGNTASDVASAEDNASPDTSNNATTPKDTTRLDADVILSGVFQPNAVTAKILKVDGRITKPSHGNAWKDFRCIRNNQDMGSLWEVRQAWSVRRK